MSYARLSSPPPPEASRNLSYPPLSQGNHNRPAMQQPQPKQGGFFGPMYPSKKSKMSSTRRRKLLLSYTPDWLITVLLAAGFFALDRVDGYRRDFSLADTSLRHPFAEHERVPELHLIAICVGIPIVIQPIINFFTVRSWWDFHNSYLGLILGLALTGSTTQLIKLTVGRPRPDIISRCNPNVTEDPLLGLTTWRVCQQEDIHLLKDGFRSFPSGHSSLSFAGLGFLSFYLAGKLHLFDKRGHAGKAWLAITPFFGAALVAISRTMDYRHHWHDVLVGSLLGIVFSFFAYRQYYPPLDSELSHRPYSPRVQEKSDESAILPTHIATANASGFSSSPPTRYSPSKFQASGSGMVNSEPYETVQLGVDGTVARPGPTSMEDVWEQGAQTGYDGTVPRSRSVGGDHSSDAGHTQNRILSRREQQQMVFQQQQPSHSDDSSPEPQDAYSIPLRSTSHPSSQQQQSRQQQSQPRQYTADAYTGIQ
ncbi:PAP2-domain-containing protein [Coprinopsis marcescibilis]|uniref:PAP2-domain-containing protein n=1 Tax=Coprinopsis marcescibilis TaxID=230819 RepID=A0A5C3L327_COPMA|nr:PAP2-domain-containing protein [Coprinopsis marcescibilis]